MEFDNKPLKLFKEKLLIKNWSLSIIFNETGLIKDIIGIIQEYVYRLNKVRRFSAPSVEDLRQQLYLDENGKYLYINHDGIVFEQSLFFKYEQFMNNYLLFSHIVINITHKIMDFVYINWSKGSNPCFHINCAKSAFNYNDLSESMSKLVNFNSTTWVKVYDCPEFIINN